MSSGSSKVIGPPQLPLSVSLGTAEDAKEALLPVLRGIPMPEWQQVWHLLPMVCVLRALAGPGHDALVSPL